jgi:large subunit ribosomal protein L4e
MFALSAGHIIDGLSELPYVVSDKIQEFNKTKQAVIFLRRSKAWADVEKVYKSQRFRAGRGKMRNRRRVQRTGPLIVYGKDDGIRKAFRNIPGVETMNVARMNLLKMAPGGHVGRFVIWTESAFKKLNDLYGSWKHPSSMKKGYNLPNPIMANTDLQRLMKSEEIRKVLKRPQKHVTRRVRRLNPLKNTRQMVKLNPFAESTKRRALMAKQTAKMQRHIENAKRKKVALPKTHPAVRYFKALEQRKKQLLVTRQLRLKRVAEKSAKGDEKAKKIKAKFDERQKKFAGRVAFEKAAAERKQKRIAASAAKRAAFKKK